MSFAREKRIGGLRTFARETQKTQIKAKKNILNKIYNVSEMV